MDRGFRNFSVTREFPRQPKDIPQADIYFTDGLQGDCFQLLKLLPVDKSFIYTNNPIIRDELRSQGRRVLEWESDLVKVIKEFSGKIKCPPNRLTSQTSQSYRRQDSKGDCAD